MGTALSTQNYNYQSSEWGDLLSTVGYSGYYYDGAGFLVYDDLWEYCWENGTQLTEMVQYDAFDDIYNWTFEYDANGMRTWRRGYNIYLYTYEDGKLIHMDSGSGDMDFFYGANGLPTALKFEGDYYYYVTNALGDVVALLNSSGEEVVRYVYDAWGNILSTTGSESARVGAINPLRYRSYVYDREIGLYYLNSRYYNPKIGRFISADNPNYLGANGTPASYNLFAYCGNNPVMGYDPTGYWDWGWEDQATLGTTVLIAGLMLLLAAPTGGSSLAVGTLLLGSTTIVAAGSTVAVAGTVIFGDAMAQAIINYAKQSKKSGKERATNKPSWVSQSDINLNKSSQQNATDLLNNKYGNGNWGKGPRTEFNQIVKWIDRGLKVVTFIIVEMLMEDRIW